jgi:hypothetical protein
MRSRRILYKKFHNDRQFRAGLVYTPVLVLVELSWIGARLGLRNCASVTGFTLL